MSSRPNSATSVEVKRGERRRKCPLLLAVLGWCIATVATLNAVGARAQDQAKQAASPKSSPSPATLIASRQIFATTCASCHGLDGRGGDRAPNILIRPEVQRMSDADIARVIRDGTPSKKMPAFGSSFDAATLHELTAYVRSLLRTNQQAAKLPGDPVTGKTLFFGKAQCSQCHMVDGEGGFLGADLTTYAHSHSADDISAAITDPNKNRERQQKTVTVVTRDGQQFTGIARNEDNFSLQLQTPDAAFHLFAKSDLAQLKYEAASLMPADYEQRLSKHELDDIVSFLMRAAANGSKVSSHSAGGDSHSRER